MLLLCASLDPLYCKCVPARISFAATVQCLLVEVFCVANVSKSKSFLLVICSSPRAHRSPVMLVGADPGCSIKAGDSKPCFIIVS
jgi:hypothetical protein